MSELVCIQTYNNRESAELAKGALEANGITAIIFADDCGGIYPQFQLIKGVKLMVNEEDVEKAQKILEGSDE